MSRPRGNKTSSAEREARQKKVAEGLASDKLQREIADELGVSLATVSRDVQALLGKFIEAVDVEDLKALKRMQVEARQTAAAALLDGELDPTVATAWAKLQDGIEKILGLQAERRLTVTHRSGEQMSDAEIFAEMTKGWSDEEHQELMDLVHAINARHVPMLDGEVVEEKEGLLGLPKPHVSHHDEEEQ